MADLTTVLIGNTTTTLNNGSGLGSTTGSTPYLESITGTDDATSYIEETTNSTITQSSLWMDLDNFDTDLGNVDTLFIRLRYSHLNPDANLTWDQLSCRIYKSDGTTALTDEMTIHNGYNSATWATNTIVQFTTVDTAATKADWDGARLYIYWDKTRSKGGNATAGMAISAGEITGTYTEAAAPVEVNVTGLLGEIDVETAPTGPDISYVYVMIYHI